MNQINEINKRFLSESFLSGLKSGSLKLELSSLIYESLTFRLTNKISQKEYSEMKNISLSSLKRIELGNCYGVRLINKYEL